jgi:hypothetical protein
MGAFNMVVISFGGQKKRPREENADKKPIVAIANAAGETVN